MKRYIFGLLAVVLLCSIAVCQTPPPTTDGTARDQKALAALQSAFQSMGGLSLSAVQDTRSVVRFQIDSDSTATYNAILTTRGLSNLRVESQGPSGSATSVITATNAASQIDGSPAERLSRLGFSEIPITHIPVIFLAGILNNPSAQIQDQGLTTDEQALWLIQVHMNSTSASDAEEPAIKVYLDPQTLSVSRIDFPQRAPFASNTFQIIEVRFEKYSPAGGLLIPSLVTYSSQGHFINSLTIVSFATNVGTTDSEFSLGDTAL
jgi:hypothetical protein